MPVWVRSGLEAEVFRAEVAGVQSEGARRGGAEGEGLGEESVVRCWCRGRGSGRGVPDGVFEAVRKAWAGGCRSVGMGGEEGGGCGYVAVEGEEEALAVESWRGFGHVGRRC